MRISEAISVVDFNMDASNDKDVYNLGLQIVGLFAIIVASALGCGMVFVFEWLHRKYGSEHAMKEVTDAPAAPGAGHSIDERSMNPTTTIDKVLSMILYSLRGIGCGVIISTALIHLIGEAYESFEEIGWADIYEQWPMVFSMAGMYLMSLAEFFEMRVQATKALEERKDAEALTTMDTAFEESEKKRLDRNHKRNAILVEGSILIHSILIGFDLGVQKEADWVPLVTAICFHQFFEGFAIGQVIQEAKFAFWKSIFMFFFYCITTAIGVAIGIGVHSTYDDQSYGANLTIGILDSLCGGILLFMGMSVFWMQWFVNNKTLHQVNNTFIPIVGFLGILIGMFIMSLIGAWA